MSSPFTTSEELFLSPLFVSRSVYHTQPLLALPWLAIFQPTNLLMLVFSSVKPFSCSTPTKFSIFPLFSPVLLILPTQISPPCFTSSFQFGPALWDKEESFLFSFIYFRNSSPNSKMFNFILVLIAFELFQYI